MILVDHEDLLLLALTIDDCSRLHVEWSGILAKVNSRSELKDTIKALQKECDTRKKNLAKIREKIKEDTTPPPNNKP